MSRILIVDDEASICWAFRESLTDEGHEVHVAASAEEGLRDRRRRPRPTRWCSTSACPAWMGSRP